MSSGIRYLKITDLDGARYILRITRESPHFIVGIEVDSEGDEIVPRGTDPEGRPWHQRERKVQRGTIKRAVEMRMNPKYATLKVVPQGERKTTTQLDAEIAEVLREHATIRKGASTADALQWSEAAKRKSDDAYSVDDHRAAAEAHRRAARLHKSDPAGKEVAWLHELAASNHRQAAKARIAERKIDPIRALRTQRTFAAYQDKTAAAREHGIMAEEYARQALAAARSRA